MRIILILILLPLSLYCVDDTVDFASAITADQNNQMKKSGSGVQGSENPDISFIIDFGGGWFSRKDHPKYGGHAIDSNGFTLQGLEMTAGAAVDPYFRFDLNFQFVGMHVEEAYVTTLALPYHQLILEAVVLLR